MNNRRLKILSKSEINELYDIPHFSTNEQASFFSLSKKEYKVMATRRSLASKVHFILQLGYFKAASQFFNCTFDTVENDVNFILKEYFGDEVLQVNSISKQTRHSNQQLIAKLLGYKHDKTIVKKKLSILLKKKSKLCNNPAYLFHEILTHSAQNKYILIGYSVLQDLIGNAIAEEEKRLGTLLRKNLINDTWKMIEAMLVTEENVYVLSALKKDPKSFKHKHIMGEVNKLENHQKLYQAANHVLPKLELSQQNISYYASLAVHYPINDLKNLSTTRQALYILCYVHNRYQKINDNLTVSYFHYIEKFKDESTSKAREHIFKEKLEINEDSKQAATVLRFFDDETISDEKTFGHVRKLAYKHIKKGNFSVISDYLEGILFDYQAIKWDEISKLKHKITKNLRPIFKSLEITGASTHKPLLSAIKFLKKYFMASSQDKKKLLNTAPLKCISKKWQEHLMITNKNAEEIIDISRYEFMVYQLITQEIEAGHLYISDSISFKSLSSYLVSDERWKDKDELLKSLGNKKLLMSIDQLLDQTEKELEQLIEAVNENISSDNPKGIKVKKSGGEITFTLPYPKSADKANHPIFQQLTQTSIAEVLRFTQTNCDFMGAFTHIKSYNAKDTLDPTAIIACIIANATNLGIHKMSETSDLNYQRMQSQLKNFIRLETLQEANDAVSNAIANLPIFKYWNIHNDYIHGSVDGQKFETRLHSFIARYSSKYFGVNKGVVACSLCANHIPVNAKIISANHHESHYLFDILFNNSSEIDIGWLSGDGHSINQLNFTFLDFIEKQFAPQFKRINNKANALCGFNPLDQYKDLLLQPKHKLNKNIIKPEWDNAQRIIASLLLGETPQHLIVSKLSSHKRKNKTKEALWEYDKILMSIYMLNFINDPSIRQNVRRALNRGEAYHQLRRAIANVHGRKFRGSNDRELELWNECARLMANCIIYYNANLLDALLTKLQKEGNDELIEQLKYISPVAWRHINLYGHYTFEGDLPTIDINKLAEAINMLGFE